MCFSKCETNFAFTKYSSYFFKSIELLTKITKETKTLISKGKNSINRREERKETERKIKTTGNVKRNAISIKKLKLFIN